MIPVRINGTLYECSDKKDLLSLLLIMLIDEHSPLETLRTNVREIFMLAEKTDRRSLRTVDRIKTKDRLLQYCYNTLLNAQGLGLLWGFSVTTPIGKGDTFYNPEIRSIVNISKV